VVFNSRGGVQLQGLHLGIDLGFCFWEFLLGALPLERGALSLGYLLGLTLLPESFYLSKVTMHGGGCVPMVG
jgi:hypothetical protein